jgi:hypothetical protein
MYVSSKSALLRQRTSQKYFQPEAESQKLLALMVIQALDFIKFTADTTAVITCSKPIIFAHKSSW